MGPCKIDYSLILTFHLSRLSSKLCQMLIAKLLLILGLFVMLTELQTGWLTCCSDDRCLFVLLNGPRPSPHLLLLEMGRSLWAPRLFNLFFFSEFINPAIQLAYFLFLFLCV